MLAFVFSILLLLVCVFWHAQPAFAPAAGYFQQGEEII
jgi:hypothetical protein